MIDATKAMMIAANQAEIERLLIEKNFPNAFNTFASIKNTTAIKEKMNRFLLSLRVVNTNKFEMPKNTNVTKTNEARSVSPMIIGVILTDAVSKAVGIANLKSVSRKWQSKTHLFAEHENSKIDDER